MPERTFDFVVIGAGKSGTTSLWKGLQSHPQVRMPSDKERPFFNSDRYYGLGSARYVKFTYPNAEDDQVLGVFAPGLPPDPDAMAQVVGRIAETVPDAKLIAILRNPIERAVSHYRHAQRTGTRYRGVPFDDFLRSQEISLADVGVVRHGLYGELLSHYLEHFSREQILVLFTQDLDERPADLFRQAFEFLGVDPDHPAEEPRINIGGSGSRVTPEALLEILQTLDRDVWPLVDDRDVRRGFTWWLRHVWNIEPDDACKEVGEEIRCELARLYLRDAEVLRDAFDVIAPWVDDLSRDAALSGAEQKPT